MIDFAELSRRLVFSMRQKHITNTQITEKLGINGGTISAWRNYEYYPPNDKSRAKLEHITAERLSSLAELLGVSVAWLIGELPLEAKEPEVLQVADYLGIAPEAVNNLLCLKNEWGLQEPLSDLLQYLTVGYLMNLYAIALDADKPEDKKTAVQLLTDASRYNLHLAHERMIDGLYNKTEPCNEKEKLFVQHTLNE